MTKSSSKKDKVLLKLKNVSKTYPSGKSDKHLFYALKDINLVIRQGEFVSITGASGSGKSTLMHIIGLLDDASQGQIILEHKNISGLKETRLAQLRNQKIGFVFQQFNLLPKTSSLENTILPLLYSDIVKKKHRQLGKQMLDKVGLSDKLPNTPAQLSGGEQQRVAIARALINQPSLILADEPTGNLDSKSGQGIMQLLKNLHREGNTIIFVTHDLDLAKQAKRTIVLKDGQIIN